jgi:hypothetical protein
MTQSRLPAQNLFTRALKNSLMLALPVLLVACGSGTETVQNPFLGGGNETRDYSGDPPANQQVKDFMDTLWTGLRAENRCGRCHDSDGGQVAFVDDTDVNAAYNVAINYVNLSDPVTSQLVTKVRDEGHNCWEDFNSVCGDTIENMISAWAGTEDNTTARVIQLTAPVIKEPGNSRNYPTLAGDNSPNSFTETVYPLLTQHCAACHYEEGITQQQNPFFANPNDAASSYEAAKSKINIDIPDQSRFVSRLLEGHNCWNSCGTQDPVSGFITPGSDARAMLDAITAFADGLTPVQINISLVTSKALTLLDGIIASGGNRHEADAIALYEFKTGTGLTAFDTSGVEPAMNLTLSSNVSWLGAYGLDFSGGKAQADTTSSKKLHDLIQSTGEYSIEAWTIPANVDQEDRSIIGYDVGAMQKNFALSQTLYNYNFSNRSNLSDSRGEAFLSSEDAGEILQSSLQHVVTTYSTINGRKIYVNGELLDVTDPVTGSSAISNWDPSYAFVLGQNANNEQSWQGKLRMVVIHNEALTDAQVLQNFEVGVGQKYFLLFAIGDEIGIADSYIRFEVSQFDSFSYLFEDPTFINLDANWVPTAIHVRNMRLGINGKEAIAGQSYANMDATVDSSYTAAEGQNLSTRGAIIALEKGPDADEFFLTFEYLEGATISQNTFDDPIPPAPADAPDAAAVSEIGVRTFDEINESIARMTGIPITNPAVTALFQQYRQQLPTVEKIDAFLSSHQMAIAQLALTSCSERVEADAVFATGSADRVLFTDFDFTQSAEVAFNDPAELDNAIDPLITAVLSSNLNSQPDAGEIKNLLGASSPQTLTWNTGSINYDSLISEMTRCPAPTDPHFNDEFPCNVTTDINTVVRTTQIVKAICAATVGSAAMLIQ